MWLHDRILLLITTPIQSFSVFTFAIGNYETTLTYDFRNTYRVGVRPGSASEQAEYFETRIRPGRKMSKGGYRSIIVLAGGKGEILGQRSYQASPKPVC
ncbi:hypothetical protein Pan54_13850 [Rubinisphaera italica]|uniref:Uncharacterized protein n=1 Tax=Rubinisphaera italica TaxID=2527969 RepID=A0A5C5XE49_9PLAN|nr:hypothetical protein [Rubinisphaera italica]TWT60671.1 hypothetical protein Pan54_13850 [Rubinisphaera italica]